MNFSDWMLKGHNFLAFVFIIYSVIFMFLALVAFSHRTTLIVCIAIVLICSALAWWFLSPRAILHQMPRANV